MRSRSRLFLCFVAPLAAGACVVGPKYQKPIVDTPATYKEWKAAEPGDAALRGAWWQVFGDPQLSALEDQVSASNQNVATAMGNFLAARALVKQARAQYYPSDRDGALRSRRCTCRLNRRRGTLHGDLGIISRGERDHGHRQWHPG